MLQCWVKLDFFKQIPQYSGKFIYSDTSVHLSKFNVLSEMFLLFDRALFARHIFGAYFLVLQVAKVQRFQTEFISIVRNWPQICCTRFKSCDHSLGKFSTALLFAWKVEVFMA